MGLHKCRQGKYIDPIKQQQIGSAGPGRHPLNVGVQQEYALPNRVTSVPMALGYKGGSTGTARPAMTRLKSAR